MDDESREAFALLNETLSELLSLHRETNSLLNELVRDVSALRTDVNGVMVTLRDHINDENGHA